MKHRTSELTGALLDMAVAKAEGAAPERVKLIDHYEKGKQMCCLFDEELQEWHAFRPSAGWGYGGPILERERISTEWDDSGGDEQHWAGRTPGGPIRYGGTPLEAAMRAYVAETLGEEVDLP